MNKALLVVVLALTVSTVNATEKKKSDGQSALQINEINGQKNKVAGDIDEEITNAKLRAESGSKSKFSLSGTVQYKGGAISSAFAADRPNLSGLPGQQVLSSISGLLNGRYRMTKYDSFTAGTTYAIMTPFEGDVTKGQKQTNIFDPTLGYNHVSKIGAFQTVALLGYAYGTSNESQSIDLTHQLGAAFNAMHAFRNHLSVGAQAATDYNYYTTAAGANASQATSAYGHDKRVAWDFAIYPQAEYQFNDRLSARTVFGYFNWRHLYGDTNQARLLHTFNYQSLGVGIAVTRDVFLYPNVQFVPDDIRSDFTNVALAATINVF